MTRTTHPVFVVSRRLMAELIQAQTTSDDNAPTFFCKKNVILYKTKHGKCLMDEQTVDSRVMWIN